MNDTGTVFHCYVVIAYSVVCFLLLVSSFLTGALEQRLISLTLKVCTLVLLEDLISRSITISKLAENCIKQSNSHIVCIAVSCLYLCIFRIRVKAQCYVGRQCPRSCCPSEEISILTYNLKSYDSGSLLNCLIALSNLM